MRTQLFLSRSSPCNNDHQIRYTHNGNDYWSNLTWQHYLKGHWFSRHAAGVGGGVGQMRANASMGGRGVIAMRAHALWPLMKSNLNLVQFSCSIEIDRFRILIFTAVCRSWQETSGVLPFLRAVYFRMQTRKLGQTTYYFGNLLPVFRHLFAQFSKLSWLNHCPKKLVFNLLNR